MNRETRLRQKRQRRAARVASRHFEQVCRFCAERFWSQDKQRLKGYMVHHIVNLCPKAKAYSDKLTAERKDALALGKAKVLTPEEAKALMEGKVDVEV